MVTANLRRAYDGLWQIDGNPSARILICDWQVFNVICQQLTNEKGFLANLTFSKTAIVHFNCFLLNRNLHWQGKSKWKKNSSEVFFRLL